MDYDKETFREMIYDWVADNSPDYDDLTINWDEITSNEGQWAVIAEDEKITYCLTDDGTGNIVINYLGNK